ncbi:hypothetical protein NPX13_g5979 [Xylaria arbuscula]|uniref:C2H2-type domain-containing protein n=1 Tax=Xylaria arbuscula TaxID=114810 RepID=A0A9W8NCQ2_9PEZI|nr:hypothetical protein NPX13_g5979 [Xylaria arbuscula]
MPLKPAVSAAARRTMKSAFDDIENTITPDDSRGFSVSTLEEVKKTALEIENQLAARQELRNMRRLMPLFQGLEHYSHIVEILCNGTPYLSWVWAPISLILRVASEYVEAFEHVIKGYSRISESLGRFRTLTKSFATNLDFQQTLAVFYSDILTFHKYAYQFVRRNGWRLLFLTSWGRFQRRFDNLVDDMKRHEQLIDLQANASHIAEAKEFREEIKVWKEDSLTRIDQLNEKESTKQYESIVTWFKVDESDQLGILDMISSESSKAPGNCSWALKNPKIKAWLQPTPDLSVLWLHGKPGSGKSVLTSEILKFMKASSKFIICHFCSQRYTSSLLYHQILRSFLLQLLRKNDELVAHVYKDCVLGRKPPTIQALEKLLLSLLKVSSSEPRNIKYVWIVLDGLNECEPSQQTGVMAFLNQLSAKTASEGDTVCKVLVSSRHSPTIAKRFRIAGIISLSDERKSVHLAIMQYVSRRLQMLHDKLRQLQLSQKDIEGLARVITNKADGMFLYARLVLDYLASNIFYSGDEMKSSVSELPEELSEFYQKILTQTLVRLDSRSVERLKSIFGWIAFSKRPLKRMELLSALSFASGNATITNLVPSYVLDVCGPLVEERPDTTLAFIHVSVKEFLQSATSIFRITREETVVGMCVSTITCLLSGFRYLFDDTKQAGAVRIVKGIHGLHVYATEFWTEHLLNCASVGGLNDSECLIELANTLANKLEKYTNVFTEERPVLDDGSKDQRLEALKEHPLISKQVEASLRARCLKRLEYKILKEIGENTPKSSHHSQDSYRPPYSSEGDGISAMLSSYQDTAAFLLQQDHFPGVSSTELEMWKGQFRTSAFTCRLGFCPRTTEGFLSEDLRRRHEMAHTQLAICTIPECQYPPFPTARALNSHMNKCHLYKPARRPIRSSESQSARHQGNTSSKKPLEMQSFKHTQINGQAGGIKVGADIVKRNNGSRKEANKQKRTDNLEFEMANEENAIDDGIRTDHTTFPKRETMRYRACTIQHCPEDFENNDASEIHKHYWGWHHADNIARCADDNCQALFADDQCLENHYLECHTALFCTLCPKHASEQYQVDGEVMRHWMLTHIQNVKRWVCDDPCNINGGLLGLVPSVPFESCSSCASGKKYERSDDAVNHLRLSHFQSGNEVANSPTEQSDMLSHFVFEVWVYEVGAKIESHKPVENGTQTWYENESDEDE